MRPRLLVLALVATASVVWLSRESQGGDRTNRRPGHEDPKIALHYDFFLSEGVRMSDASGNKHDGTLRNGEVVYGRRKNAVKLDGKGMILAATPESLNPASRPFTVGALCQPAAADGVIASMGDHSNGFSLYLKGGIPQFAVRTNGRLITVSDIDPLPMDQWVHLAGAIDAKGTLWLIVNSWPVAHVKGELIRNKPSEPFCVGADPGSPVGEKTTSQNWRGLLQDVRLYWGFMDPEEHRDTLKDWGDMPGCGCK
jgi:hypothetical protein